MLVRPNVVLAETEATIGLFLVADGTSDVGPDTAASRVVVRRIARHVITAMRNTSETHADLVGLLFKCAVMQAGTALLAQNATYHMDARTTVAGALVIGGRAYIVNAGNSRAYLCGAEDGLWQVMQDRSAGLHVAQAGPVGAEVINTSRLARPLDRRLGDAEQMVRVDTCVTPLCPGDQLLLCSDGLWRQIPDAHIEAILRGMADPHEAVAALVQVAGRNGCDDDISAIVVLMLDGDARERPLSNGRGGQRSSPVRGP